MKDKMSETEKNAADNTKVKQFANWKNNPVYNEVQDKNQTNISTRWVIKTTVIKVIKSKISCQRL